MEIKRILFMARRWFWLLILGLTIGLLSGIIVSRIMTPVFKAETKVLVSRDPQAATAEFPNLNDIQLVQTYVELLSTDQLRNQVSDMVGFTIDKDNVLVEQLRDTQIIQIGIEDTDPERAKTIANSMVSLLELQTKQLQDAQYLTSETSLQEQAAQAKTEMDSLQSQIDTYLSQGTEEQLVRVHTQITTLEEQISVLQSEIASLGEPLDTGARVQIAEKQTQLTMLQGLLTQYQGIRTNLLFLGKPYEVGTGVVNPRFEQLQSTLDLYQQIYLGHLSSLENLRLMRMQNTPTITQIEPAVVPEEPVRPILPIYAGLAGLAGLMFAMMAVIAIEFLDGSVKVPEDIEPITGAPVLGLVRKVPGLKDHFFQGKDISKPPLSTLFEDYRSLGFQIENQLGSESFSSLMVTSCSQREGKSTAAVNLATIYARSGKRVLLLDANQKKPRLHTMLGENSEVQVIDLASVSRERSNLAFDPLDMSKISVLFEKIQERGDRIAIIDAPPMFSADAKILASRVDGVLLVVEAWETEKESLQAAINQLRQLNANLIGIMLNKIPLKYSYYYDSYQFLTSDYEKYTRAARLNVRQPRLAKPPEDRYPKSETKEVVK